ncbi:MAG: bifunctional hydroxymethylpyrimidine kinase/phosphomethylpyrimidine kinase [Rhodocyclaceae bacterium]|nr:bifunctional hydroxymethylpyrimidine kinase/phosphomethylpyrimidine kinase [Rhodocyclaceae bacterium]
MHRPPAVLALSSADPTSASGVTADAVTLASMGIYPLCVVTEVCLRDTAEVDARVALDGELVVDQARMVLEDVPVAVIKLTLPGSVDLVAALAELISDYPDAPLILEVPGQVHDDDAAEDEHLAAALELLLPQTTVLVVDASAAQRLVAAGLDDEDHDLDGNDLPALLCDAGAGFVLLLGAPGAGQQAVHVLHGPSGVVQRDVFERVSAPALGFAASVAAALAGAMALGRDESLAVKEALQYAHRADAERLRMGMGLPVPDRMFWARPAEAAQ